MTLTTLAFIPLTLASGVSSGQAVLEPAHLPATTWPQVTRSADMEDIDGDGVLDLLVRTRDGQLRIYIDHGGALEDRAPELGIPADLVAVDVAWLDFDLDGDVDIVAVTSDGVTREFANEGGAFFLEVAPSIELISLVDVLRTEVVESPVGGAPTLVVYSEGGARALRPTPNGLEGAPVGPYSTPSPGTPSRTPQTSASSGLLQAFPALCAPGILDAAGGSCLPASSFPAAGSLFPLGEELMILGNGNVGLSTSAPDHRLHVKAPTNTQGWGDAIVVAEYVNDVIGFGLYSSHRKWDIANLGTSEPDRFAIRDSTAGKERLTIDEHGHTGIATNSPSHLLHVRAPSNTQGWGDAAVVAEYTGDIVGFGLYNDDRRWDIANLVSPSVDRFAIRDSTEGKTRFVIDEDGQVGIGTLLPEARLDVAGRARVEILEITGGMDIVEKFETGAVPLEPGTVVSIDPTGTGKVIESTKPFDPAVAGVVSGAGGIRAGIALTQDGLDTGTTPVAMTGRVFVKATVENGPILPGDRLTTSSVPGHAMRVAAGASADGTVLGKALTRLDEETGLVLVLVNLQ